MDSKLAMVVSSLIRCYQDVGDLEDWFEAYLNVNLKIDENLIRFINRGYADFIFKNTFNDFLSDSVLPFPVKINVKSYVRINKNDHLIEVAIRLD